MPLALFYDTETTGLPLFKEPSDDPGQPHIVQVAAALVDVQSRMTLASFDLTICPDGWEIPEEVTAIHGVSTEHAKSVGVPESVAVNMLLALWEKSDFRIAHNQQFDQRIIRIGLKRFSTDDQVERWSNGAVECTALMSTAHCKLPPTDKMKAAGRNNHKMPKLIEAYQHFFGEEFDGQHTAVGDVIACTHVYFAIQDALAAEKQQAESPELVH